MTIEPPSATHSTLEPSRRWRVVETSRTLDRAVRIATNQISNGADGRRLAIRVEGLSTVPAVSARPTVRATAIAAVPALVAGTAVGVVLAILAGEAVVRWAILGAVIAMSVGMASSIVRHARDQRRRSTPLLGARRFVVARDDEGDVGGLDGVDESVEVAG
jgi:hypothetical protein